MLGLVCMYIDDDRNNLMNCRTLQLGRYNKGLYSEEKLRNTYLENASNLLSGLDLVLSNGIKLFRFSSDLIPLADKVPREYWDNPELVSIYRKIGEKCMSNGMRITAHPAQFCILNSDSDRVIENSVRDLEMHAWIFDACGFEESPYYAINIHAGCRDRFSRLIESIHRLPTNIRKRLTFENCETVASVGELLEVSSKTDVPITFDAHHHTFRNFGISSEEASNLSRATWPEHIRPLQHISNTEPGLENSSFQDRRKHSDYIHYVEEHQLRLLHANEIDVECEAKAKNFAVLKMSKDFSVSLA